MIDFITNGDPTALQNLEKSEKGKAKKQSTKIDAQKMLKKVEDESLGRKEQELESKMAEHLKRKQNEKKVGEEKE